MSTELIERPMSVIERASNALSKAEVEIEIKALVLESSDIVAVTDPASREACHDKLMVLKNMRVRTEKAAKAGREEATQYSKAVIAIEKELVALIAPEENRLASLRDEWDSAKERERQARVDAEIARVASIQERITELRGCQTLSPSSGSTLVLEHIADLEGIVVDASFDEFEQQASDAKTAAMVRLNGILGAAVAHEAEQAKIIAEREELAKLRAAEEVRQADAREAQAKIDADAKAARDLAEKEANDKRVAEARAHAEQIRKDRERIAKEEADAKAIRDAEQKRIDDERRENERIAEEQRKANAAEEKRLADQRAEIAAQQEALRKAAEPKPEPESPPVKEPTSGSFRTIKRPATTELVACVSEKWKVSASMAEMWLKTIKWEAVAA